MDPASDAIEPSTSDEQAPEPSLWREDLEKELLELAEGHESESMRAMVELLSVVKGDYAESDDPQAVIDHAVHLMRAENQKHVPNAIFTMPPQFETSREVFESDGRGALWHHNLRFHNWGTSVDNKPSSTWQIRTVQGLQNVILWAGKKNLRVRVAGFRHSWTNIFAADGDVLIMLAPYNSLVELPYHAPKPKDWKSDLNTITEAAPFIGPQKRTPEPGHGFVRVGAAVMNEDLRLWCFEKKKYCIPMNVIMVEVTFGGTNATVCHGAGFGTRTLSDLVVEVEYVDAKGRVQVVNNPDELRAATGCFGLLGVVTALTLQLEDMHIAELRPVKQNIALAIPPPEGYKAPPELEKMINGIPPKKRADALAEFIRRCEEDYYLEWFWFPYQKGCWVNTWKRHPATAQEKISAKTYPSVWGSWAQGLLSTWANELFQWWIWKKASGYQQAFWQGLAAMATLPDVAKNEPAVEALQSDAVHFRRGTQNFRVRDTEWEIPIPGKGGKRDYTLIQKAWWDGISAMYADKTAPVRIALEMRLTGGSDVLLAPQYGNDKDDRFGTVSIEVITTLGTPENDWNRFKEAIANTWTSYKDEHGVPLNARPHWAKEWEGMNVQGKPVRQYLREQYKDVLPLFRETFENIVKNGGSTVEETRARFGNNLMSSFIFDD